MKMKAILHLLVLATFFLIRFIEWIEYIVQCFYQLQWWIDQLVHLVKNLMHRKGNKHGDGRSVMAYSK
jgi:hypothetical protein